jgi:MFS family permease
MSEVPTTPRTPVLPLVFGQMGLHATMAGLRLAAPLMALREGYSAWSVGVLLALFAAMPVLSSMPAGRLADRHGYHRMVVGCVLLAATGAAFAVLSTYALGGWRFAALCVAASLCGTAANTGVMTIQRAAGLAASTATERVRLFSWLGVAPPAANVVGPVSVGLIIDTWGFTAAYLWLLLLPWLALATMAWVPRRVAPPKPPEAGARRTTLSLLHAPGLRRLLVVNWLFSMAWDVHTFAVPIIGHERGYSASTIGTVLAVFTAAVVGVRLLIPVLAHRMKETQVMHGAMLSTGLIFAAYPFAPNPWVLLGLAAMLGFSLGCVQPMMMSLLHQLTPDQRYGETLALRAMVMNACGTVMPLVFGAVGAVTGAGLLFWSVAAALGLGSGLPKGLLQWVTPEATAGPAPQPPDTGLTEL